MRLRGVGVLGGLVMGMAMAKGAWGALVTDAGYLPSGSPTTVITFPASNPNGQLAQTFTVEKTGDLKRCDVDITRLSGTTGDLEIIIKVVDSVGFPGGTIRTTTVPVGSIGVSPVAGFVTADFSGSPVPVVAGERYGIILQCDAGDSVYEWAGDNAGDLGSEPYAGGTVMGRGSAASSWTIASPSMDMGFRTFVEVAVPEPGTMLMVGVGVVGLLRRRR